MAADLPIAILGGGPTGLTCALLLARSGRRCVVVDAQTVEQTRGDRRVLALGRGSWQILRPLLASPPPRAAIRDVYVSSQGEFGVTHIAASDFDGNELGATVFYGDLVAALAAAAVREERIAERRPQRVLEVQQIPSAVRVRCEGGDVVEAALAINAEGWSGAAGSDEARSTGEAVGLVGDVRVSGPDATSAFERFTREGPLAVLPSPAGTAPLRTIVWCMSAAQAERRLALPPALLSEELQRALGARVGRLEWIGPLRRHHLHERMRSAVRSHRCVAIGNAAQTLHPVAGQGFNLAVRDCATLVQCLTRHEVPAALREYERLRRVDRVAIGTVTRWLPRLFATRFAPIAAARALGLTALDLVPPLRKELAQLLMFGVRE